MSGPSMYPSKAETADGLPKQFVSSLRILFDILDENRTGLVRLKDIESRWSDDGVRGLPAGVVDGLRRVTPQDGLLSFDKFVAGLKLVLNMRKGTEPRKPFISKENRAPYHDYRITQIKNNPLNRESHQYGNESHYPASRRINSHNEISQETPFIPSQKKLDQWHNNDTQVHHGRMNDYNRNIPGQPTYQRRDESPVRRETTFNAYAIKADVRNYPSNIGSHQSPSQQENSTGGRGFQRNSSQPENPPALPPRRGTSTGHVGIGANAFIMPSQMRKSHSGPELHQAQSPPAIPPRVHRPNFQIAGDLKNWQKEWTANHQNAKSGVPEQWHKSQRGAHSGNYDNGNAIYANIEQFQRKKDDPIKQQQVPQKVTVRRHGSGRRHTLSSGIDQNMLKRMKQLEEERAVLQSGLAMVDTARDWYLKQMAMINDKQAMLGKVSYNDNSLEAHQERMSFQRARIAEVNQQLGTLVESSEKGFPLHMNLAVTNHTTRGVTDQTLILRNRKLMEEMNHKTNLVSQLEKEKATLIRDLFEARSKNKSNHDDTTFM